MTALLLKIGSAFTLLLVLPILLIQVQPPVVETMPVLLAPPEGCPAPCFMGIRPGVTTMDEAVSLLKTNAWVDRMRLEDYQLDLRGVRANGWLSFTWSAAHPAQIDPTVPGRIYFAQADRQSNAILVESIAIPTLLRTYQVQQWFGQASSGMVGIDGDRRLNYIAVYPPGDLAAWVRISTELRCPASLMGYWDSHAEIMLSTAPITGDYLPFDDVVRMC